MVNSITCAARAGRSRIWIRMCSSIWSRNKASVRTGWNSIAEIRAKIEIARQAVKRTYEWVMQAWNGGSVDRHYAQDEWRKAQRIFSQRLAEINKLISTFNLELPERCGTYKSFR